MGSGVGGVSGRSSGTLDRSGPSRGFGRLGSWLSGFLDGSFLG